nr:hypothetical protein [Amycolatopsis nigrescens]
MVAVCLLSLVLCCGLAWWQWERFSSASGTFQNLGYVLQWPLFGLFPAFMFWRFRRLRAQAAEQDEVSSSGRTEWGHRPADVPPPRPAPSPQPVQAAPEDDELAAYNRYLAELNAADRQDR